MNGQRYYTVRAKERPLPRARQHRVDQKQLAWVETTLRDAKEDWKICYFHHPLYSNAGAPRIVRRPPRAAGAALHQVRRQRRVLRARSRLRARQAAEGHLLFRLGRGRPAAERQHAADRDETAAYFDQDQSFMLVEIAGDEMYFQVDLAHRQSRSTPA